MTAKHATATVEVRLPESTLAPLRAVAKAAGLSLQTVLKLTIATERLREQQREMAERGAPFVLLADIRAAAGDREGKLMQDELMERIRQQRADSVRLDFLESYAISINLGRSNGYAVIAPNRDAIDKAITG
jgi:hypothetical protein